MDKALNLFGLRYGKLIVLSRADSLITKGRAALWLCRCDCGRYIEVTSSNLRRREYASCGCTKHKWFSDFDKAVLKVLSRYKTNAKKRHLDFSLTYQQFLLLITSSCIYCGKLPSLNFKNKHKHSKHIYSYSPSSLFYSSIDRLDYKRGYLIENCVSSCQQCNQAKHKLLPTEFLILVKRIYEFRNLSSLNDLSSVGDSI